MLRNKEIPIFFGLIQLKGEKVDINSQLNNEIPQIYYKHQNGELWFGDSLKWLKTLESKSIDMIFADPPYNIKKADL